MSLASTVTMTELKKQAKARGIKGSANMTKVQLCKALGLKGNCMPFSRCLNYVPISNAMAAEHPFIQNLNCYNLPLQHIKYILGPCSFYQYNAFGRHFYLFGEVHLPLSRQMDHLSKENTVTFTAFVNSLVTQRPSKTYDLMFENVYFLSKDNDESAVLDVLNGSPTFSDINEKFRNCIKISERHACPYTNLRTHYVDYRWAMDPVVRQTKVPRGETVVSLPPIAIRKKMKSLMTAGRVFKQISAIKNESLREALLDFFQWWLSSNPSGTDPNGAGFKMAAIMDLYAIARIFREFDPTIDKGNKAFKGTSENVIYYAGNLHILRLVKFFNGLGIQPTYSVTAGVDKYHCKSFLDINMRKTSFF